MGIVRAGLVAAAACAACTAAAGAGPAAPAPGPLLRVPGPVTALAASGSTLAVASVPDSGCVVRLLELPSGRTAAVVPGPAACRGEGEAWIDDVSLGRTTLAATTLDSPSPHTDDYASWAGPRPKGPLRQVGEDWGFTDSDVPNGYGCVRSVAAGGGVVASTAIPNTLGVDRGSDPGPACPAGAAQLIALAGAARRELVVPGSWRLLATDGKRLALARLDEEGEATGELSLVDLAGKPLPAPKVAPAAVKSAYQGWLVPEGLVLATGTGVSGPGWTLRGGASPTVAEGRLLYRVGRTVRVRRLRDGVDRRLLTLPTSEALLAAGSFGLAIATTDSDTSTIARVAWRTIDRTLPVR